ncbi:uncharacterized protein LOC135936560 [Cloeon dipterum]|uniref:uncharacterized protein LOC135936560 n=1 Tax=Cloeon dipterum TaxID=197152 RepID=UPI003220671A
MQAFKMKLPGWAAIKETKFDSEIEDTRFFESAFGCGYPRKTKKSMLMTFKLSEYMIPQYLPTNFHMMEFGSESSAEEILTALKQATFYLLSTHLCRAMKPRKMVKMQETQKDELLEFYRTIVEKADIKLLEEPIFLNDILQEPRILIQLPFQVNLIYQTMLALIYEGWRVCTQQSEFCIFDIPADVEPLYKILSQFQENLHKLAGELSNILTKNFKATSNTIFGVNTRRLFFNENKVWNMSLLEFIWSGSCTNVTKALKKILSRTLQKLQTCSRPAPSDLDFPAKEFRMHFLKFWKFECLDGRNVSRCPDANLYNIACSKFRLKDICLQNMIQEYMINTGKISGITAEEAMSSVTKRRMMVSIYSQMALTFIEQHELDKGFQDAGVIFSIICNAEAKAKAAPNFVHLCQMIVSANPEKAKFHAIDCDGPDMSLSQITKELEDVDKKINSIQTRCSLEEEVMKMLQEVQFPEQALDEVPDVELLGVENTVLIFEAALKHRVFKVYTDYFECLALIDFDPLKSTFSPKLLFVQYIFPHLVRLLRTMNESPMTEQKKYVYFLHQLLSSNFYKPSEEDENASPWPNLDTVDGILSQGSKEFHKQKIRFVQQICSKLFATKQSEILIEYFDFLGLSMELPYEGSYLVDYVLPWNIQIVHFLKIVLVCLENTCDSFDCSDMCICSNVPDMTISILEVLYVHFTKNNIPVFENDFLNQVLRSLNGHNEIALKSKTVIAASFSNMQLFGVIMYLAFQYIADSPTLIEKTSRMLLVKNALVAYQNQDFWRAKQNMAMLVNDAKRVDMSLFDLTAFRLRGGLYKQITMNTEKSVGRQRVKMNKPGEITFCPIKHCRWCGLINSPDFNICQECQYESDYPDVNLFCSKECEERALNDSHLEEHARFLIEQMKF